MPFDRSLSLVIRLGLVLPVFFSLMCAHLEASAGDATSPLLQPKSGALTQTAPATFKVKFVTTEGDFIVESQREWAPRGVDRFYNLVKNGYYDGVCFFRVISGFMAQFGIHGDPKVSAAWRSENLQDDPVKQSNKRGYISYAMAGPNTRTTQLFINYGDNSRLDQMGFAPIAHVVQGMDVVDRLHSAYGEGAPSGKGPDQRRLQMEGGVYLSKEFSQLDCIKTATIVD